MLLHARSKPPEKRDPRVATTEDQAKEVVVRNVLWENQPQAPGIQIRWELTAQSISWPMMRRARSSPDPK